MRKKAAVCMFLLASVAVGQVAPDPRRAEVDQKVTKILLAFARTAKGQRMPSKAREAYRMVVDEYDENQPGARKGLGFKKVRGEWQPDPRARKVADSADGPRQRRVEKAWKTACAKACKLHREFAQALDGEGHRARAILQFERALAFSPDDRASHLALGHKEYDGFFGTDEQIGVVKRLREIVAFAAELGEREYEVETLPQSSLPTTLRKSGLEFFGVRTEHFTHWYTGSEERAIAGVQWAERAWDLLGYLLGDAKTLRVAQARKWFAVLETKEQQVQMLTNAPASRDNYTLEQAKLFGGSGWKERGRRVGFIVGWHQNEADTIVGHVAMRYMPYYNCAFSEGIVHACTSLLCGTTQANYISLPKTMTKGHKPLGSDPKQWRVRLQDAIERGESWPLIQLPRERSDNFRQEARLKVWSFTVFLFARYPDTWLRIIKEIGTEKGLMVEDVAEKFEKATGRSVGEIEEEWREWARRGSTWGRASGW